MGAAAVQAGCQGGGLGWGQAPTPHSTHPPTYQREKGSVCLLVLVGPAGRQGPAAGGDLREGDLTLLVLRLQDDKDLRLAGIGGLSEVLGWNQVQREASKTQGAFGGYENLLKVVSHRRGHLDVVID